MKKKAYALSMSFIIFIFWLICFILNKKGTDSILAESIELYIISASVAGLLIFVNDIFYPAVIICYMPFLFARPLQIDKTPLPLLISCAMIVAGLAVRMVKYKVKLKTGNLTFGLTALAISFIAGGIGNKENTLLGQQLLLCTLIAIALLLLYIILVSSAKNISFDDLCDTINCLALLLILQVSVFYIFNWNRFETKNLMVGWGGSNNVPLMLLLCLPFAFYRFCFGNRKFDFLYILAMFLELFVIIISYSRGCIIFGTTGVLYMVIFTAFRQKKKFIKTISPVIIICFIGALVCLVNNELFNAIITNITNNIFDRMNFETGNGRYAIYKDYFSSLKNHLIFGYGTFYPLLHHVDGGSDSYQWAHNTFLQATYTLGLFGLLALIWHLTEKYYGVIHKIDDKKHILLLAYLLSGLYGLIDLSYFFINYMIVLFIIFVFSEEYTDRINYKKGR